MNPQLSSGSLLARNTVINFGGLVAPLLAALIAIPMLVAELGTARFGFLTVAWVVIGYFGLFDLGLGRALTKLASETLGRGEDEHIGPLTWTALLLMALLGLVGAVAVWAVTPWLVNSALNIPVDLRREAEVSMRLMAISLPWVITTAGLRGILEATQKFGIINALRVPMGLVNYLGPLAVLPFSTSLIPITAVLIAGRIVACLAHLYFCIRLLPQLASGFRVDWSHLGALSRFGGWITVSNIISPLMNYLDRFLVGALVSMTAVAYYVTPYEVVMKLGLLPAALLGVLFPAFSATFASDPQRTRRLFDQGTRLIFLAVFPVSLTIVTLAQEGMGAWLGAEFASQSTRVLQWLAAGVLVNALAQVPFAAVQGVGRPDVSGKLHIAEIPLYGALILVLATRYGIEGVAMAWTIRVTVDAFFLFMVADRFLPAPEGTRAREMVIFGLAAAAIVVGAMLGGLLLKLAYLSVVLGIFGWIGWRQILRPQERKMLGDWADRAIYPARVPTAEGMD